MGSIFVLFIFLLMIWNSGGEAWGPSTDRDQFMEQVLEERAKGAKKGTTPSPTFSPTMRTTSSPTVNFADPAPTPDNSQGGDGGGIDNPQQPIGRETVPPTDRPQPSPTIITDPVSETTSPPTSSPILAPVENTTTPPDAQPAGITPTPSISPPQLPSQPSLCNLPNGTAFFQALGHPFTSTELFGEPTSDQCRALQRVAEQEGYQTFGFEQVMRYWVLYCIYFATSSSTNDSVLVERQESTGTTTKTTTWTVTTGWEATNLDPCNKWYGIVCDFNGIVTEIRLSRNGLSGTFPSEIVYLSSDGAQATGAGSLQRLELFDNPSLTNDDVSWIAELGSSLKVLNYGSTSFKGPLPKLPPGIEEFDCSYTLQYGAIPESIFVGLNNLRLLNMDGNKVDAAIPTTMATLPSLQFFYIREAGVKGDLTYMKGMPSIVEHLVDGNPELTGPIPSFIGELQTLKSFSATDCGLTGTLPSELANLSGLTQLWLYGNRLTGQIPSEYAQISGLRILALEDTDITGNVPIEICLRRFEGALTTMSTDCAGGEVECSDFFPDCCTCCGRPFCGT